MTQSAKRREIFQSWGSAANATLLKKLSLPLNENHLSPSSERTPNHFVQHDQYGNNRKMLNLAQSLNLKFCCNSHRSLLNSLFPFSYAGFLSILANVVTFFYVRYFVCTFFFLFLLRFCTSEYKWKGFKQTWFWINRWTIRVLNAKNENLNVTFGPGKRA